MAKNSSSEISVRRNFLTSKIPYSENSLRRKLCTAKFPYGEKSVLQKLRSAENPTAKSHMAKNVTAKFLAPCSLDKPTVTMGEMKVHKF